MKRVRFALAAMASAALVAACGGGGDGSQAPATQYSALVSFGDSLSDVGTYAVGGVAAAGGGKYTVNGASAKNWTELLAAQLGLRAPCPAETGLAGSVFSAPIVDHAGCFNYAQGGSRVTIAVGPGNAALGGANAQLGQLTVPVVTQIQRHLTAVGGRFSGNELVTVMAGGNDVFINAGTVAAYQAANPSDAAGITLASQNAVAAMGLAGAQLASYIATEVVAKGAKRVMVTNLVDVSKSPYVYGIADATARAQTAALIQAMVGAFNAQLASGLSGVQGVLLVDAYTASRDQAANPSQYDLTNATTPACNLTAASNPLQSSLTCTESNVVSSDVSKYLFADSVHPTPYGYRLLAQLITQKLVARGWL